MSLTKKMLKGYGLTDEQIEAVFEGHQDTVTALKEQIEKYRVDAEKLPEVQSQLDGLKSGDDGWKAKYEKEHSDFESYKASQKAEYDKVVGEFETYKTEQESAKTNETKRNAYKNLLKNAGVIERSIDDIAKLKNLAEIELDENGAIKDSEAMIESVKKDWSGLIAKVTTQGAQTTQPPIGTTVTSGMTYDQIASIKDRAKLREAIKANPQAFTRGE